MKKHCFTKKIMSVLLSSAVMLASISVPAIAAEDIQLLDDASEVFMEEVPVLEDEMMDFAEDAEAVLIPEEEAAEEQEIAEQETENKEEVTSETEALIIEELVELEAYSEKAVELGTMPACAGAHVFTNNSNSAYTDTCKDCSVTFGETVVEYSCETSECAPKYFTTFEDAVAYAKAEKGKHTHPKLEIFRQCTYAGTEAKTFVLDNAEIVSITLDDDASQWNLGNASLKLEKSTEEAFKDESSISISAHRAATITSISSDATIQGSFIIDDPDVTVTNTNPDSGCALKGRNIRLAGPVKVDSSGSYAIYMEAGNLELCTSWRGSSYQFPVINDTIYLSNGATISLKFYESESIQWSSTSYSVKTENVSQILIPKDKIKYIDYVNKIKKIFRTNKDEKRAAEYDDDGNLVWMNCPHKELLVTVCQECNAKIVASVTVNDSVSNYETMEEATAKAVNGAVVTLIRDTKLGTPLLVDKAITLDLNGKTLSTNDTDNKVMCVENGNVTITDNSSSGSGNITGVIKVSDDGQLDIAGGRFGSAPFEVGVDAAIILSGGIFENGFSDTMNAEDLTSFLADGFVYRDKDGKAIYLDNDSKNAQIYTVSPFDFNHDIDVTLNENYFRYNGVEQKPDVNVSYDGYSLEEDTEYTIEWPEDMVSAGEKTMYIIDTKDNNGKLEATYTITKAPLTIQEVKVSDREYNSSDQIEITEVVLSGVCGKDEVSVSDTGITGTISSENAGTYDSVQIDKLTLTGKDSGNYELTFPIKVSVEGKITPKDISKSISVTGLIDKTYTGSAQTQELVVKDGNTTLTEGTDYTVTYKDNTNAGIATVTLEAKGNYTGSVTKTFEIFPVETEGDTDETEGSGSGETEISGEEENKKPEGSGSGETEISGEEENKKPEGSGSGETEISGGEGNKEPENSGNGTGSSETEISGSETEKDTSKPEISEPDRNEPDQVSSLKVSKSTTKAITLKWNKVTGADGYTVYRWNSGTKKWKKLDTTTKLTYTDKNRSAGKKYKYAVSAYDKKGGKIYTSEKEIIKAAAAPASVKNLKVKKTTKTTVTLSWKKVTNATGYIVYRQNTGSKKWIKVGTTKKTSYTNRKLKKGKNYKYAVSAYVSYDGKTYSSTKKTVKTKTKK